MRESRARFGNVAGARPLTAFVGLALLLAGCGSRQATPAPTPGSVATYRGDAARTGAMPGPAPSGIPSVAWTFQAGAPIGSAPAVVDGVVYLLSNDGVIHAIDLEGAQERWQVELGEDASASPLVADGLLIVGDSAGMVHGLAIADGSTRWTLATDGPISGSGAAIRDVAVLATTAGSAYAIDIQTGTVRWSSTLGGPVSTSVAIADAIVYLGAGPNLVAVAAADGTIRWMQAISKEGRIGTPTAAGGLVYAATGLDAGDLSVHGVVALEAASGAVRWRFASPVQAVVYTPAVVGGRAYVVGEDRRVTALDAETGAVIWTTVTEQVNESVAAVADGLVFVAGNGGAMNAIATSTGEIRWTVQYRGVPYGATVVDGYALVGTDVGTLVAIGGPIK